MERQGETGVLRDDLSTSRVLEDLIWNGGLFQSLGAADAKALSLLMFSLVFGTTNNGWSEDLKALVRDVEMERFGDIQRGQSVEGFKKD